LLSDPHKKILMF